MSGFRDKGGDLPHAATEVPHFHGHRERLKARFRDNGATSLADYELLELLLFQAVPRRDTKPLAKALLARFGSFSEVLAAPEAQLLEVAGIGEGVAHHLKLVLASAQRFARDRVADRPLLDSWNAVIDHCRAAMGYEAIEHFRILFLNKKNQLIADEVQQSGTVDHTPVYPREIVKRALELSATAIILVHNHRSGDPTPLHSRYPDDKIGRGHSQTLGNYRPRPHHRGEGPARQLQSPAVDLTPWWTWLSVIQTSHSIAFGVTNDGHCAPQ